MSMISAVFMVLFILFFIAVALFIVNLVIIVQVFYKLKKLENKEI